MKDIHIVTYYVPCRDVHSHIGKAIASEIACNLKCLADKSTVQKHRYLLSILLEYEPWNTNDFRYALFSEFYFYQYLKKLLFLQLFSFLFLYQSVQVS